MPIVNSVDLVSIGAAHYSGKYPHRRWQYLIVRIRICGQFDMPVSTVMLIAKTYTYHRILAGMEYNSVTFVAYFSAAVISALLTMTYLFQLVRKQKTWL